MSFTVIQRKRMTQDERDLAEFFDPMNEAEAYSLALRLTAYDAIRCSYRVKELPEC